MKKKRAERKKNKKSKHWSFGQKKREMMEKNVKENEERRATQKRVVWGRREALPKRNTHKKALMNVESPTQTQRATITKTLKFLKTK